MQQLHTTERPPDYLRVYHLERYLFDDVSLRFCTTGRLLPTDFQMIIIWKANRAKTRVRARLIARAGTFAHGVHAISTAQVETKVFMDVAAAHRFRIVEVSRAHRRLLVFTI
jgi:hypothetical protein